VLIFLRLFLLSVESNCFYQDSSPESGDDYDDDSNIEVDLTYEPSSDDDVPIQKKSRKVREPTLRRIATTNSDVKC
jgi:hypothetical protein